MSAQRMLNTHYVIPLRIRIVELMTSGSTHDDIFPYMEVHLRASGMLPVMVHRESTGFVLNRVWAAIKRDCLMVLSEGVATPAELDAAWTEMFIKDGNPPCATMDSVGLDTVSLIEEHYIDERGLKDMGEIPFLQTFIDEGNLGAKSSKGGLHRPGHTTKAAGQEQTSHDNLHAPSLYIPDLGLNNDPSEIVGKIFGSNMGVPNINDGCIMSCNLDGSKIKVIVPTGSVHTPKQLAVDWACSRLFFSDREGMRVFRCDVDGSGLETLIQNGDWKRGFKDQTLWCAGIAVAPREGKFYWAQKGPSKGSQGRIFRASIEMPDGADASTRMDIECPLSQSPEPIDIEIDEDGRAMYWTDRGEYGNHQILARNLHEAIGLAIDKTNRYIYATDIGSAVYRFNMDGSDRRKFYEEQGSFAGIALCDV
ncbi:hypothetical protein B0T25DRAFT_573700 [Lasiosphaeria hispida]|uniref:3-hydroxyacyl-CoA dehydrogenase C-terminal domain-containing protein n=1 Tax=Lasiosphaeria hispida TaxID=260671 RepID=A0AAJ0H607_9PEZI|nr:hypothetical protein B0T25DRAFT_573700 [Lasiosphaeria hispida]